MPINIIHFQTVRQHITRIMTQWVCWNLYYSHCTCNMLSNSFKINFIHTHLLLSLYIELPIYVQQHACIHQIRKKLRILWKNYGHLKKFLASHWPEIYSTFCLSTDKIYILKCKLQTIITHLYFNRDLNSRKSRLTEISVYGCIPLFLLIYRWLKISVLLENLYFCWNTEWL